MAIISRSKGFIFLKVAKTGSTTMTRLLCGAGCVDTSLDTADVWTVSGDSPLEAYHVNLATLLEAGDIAAAEHDAMPVFALYRDPVDRFVSAVAFSQFSGQAGLLDYFPGKTDSDVPNLTYADFLAVMPALQVSHPSFKPQTYWLADPKVTVLAYANYQVVLSSFIAAHGGAVDASAFKFRMFDSSVWKAKLPALTDLQTAQVKAIYAADYAFAPT